MKKFNFHDLTTIFLIVVFTFLGYSLGKKESQEKLRLTEQNLQKAQEIIKNFKKQTVTVTPTSTPIPQITPTALISPTSPSKKQINSAVSIKPNIIYTPTPTEPWGVAKQLDEKTWTMNIAMDDRMATQQEVLDALNNYRQRHGRQTLTWDENLTEFAQSRAKYFTDLGKLDAHAGFVEYTKDIENIKKLGFWSLGENSSYGYQMYGVHLIEWIFAGDEPHNNNQLNSAWSHVGIGINGNQVDIIFGGNKM